jgi:hypothetical protein
MNKLRNKFEIKVYKSLKRQKVKFTYETVKIPYVLAKHYIPDFIIQTRLGKIYLECKGYLRPEDKAKLVAVKRQNPALDIRLLFYSSNKRNIRWAEKVGIRYAIDKVPLEWLEGL